MSEFIDYGNSDFESVKNSKFVDKSGLLNVLNSNIDTEDRFMCISRPRRFGKSVAAKMAYAYYDRFSDSRKLFDDLEISKSPDYEKHLNKYPAIFIDWNRFAAIKKSDIVTVAQKKIVADLKKSYPFLKEENILFDALTEINETTGDRFIMIIDEWDMLVRDEDKSICDQYVNFLRSMFKANSANKIFLLVYMTGILPIIKYETQSAMNNFREQSVINPGPTAKYYGFTKEEVKTLCEKYNMDLEQMEHAYDGYIVGDETSMFNPNSVMLSIYNRNYNSYWAKSASYTFIEPYIHIDENNVKPKIEKLLNGEEITIEVTSFRNDFRHIESYDDVFTLLVHLGYLSYNPETNGVMIPNTEVAGEFRITLSKTGWGWISKAMANSLTLVEKTISLDSQYVASSFDDCRPDASSFININSEAAMAVAIRFAYYAAIKDYKIFHELPTGKGFADMVFVPVNKPHRPAIVVELKYDKTAEGAIEQIKRKDYPKSLKGFSRRIILVGINYNTKESKHEVEMEVIEGN